MPTFPKPAKGTHWREGRERRKSVVAEEEAAKAYVRSKDVRCRWPHCANCRSLKPRLEVAHLVPKGAGGSNDVGNLILLDFLTHQSGPSSLEQHGKRIVPVTAQGTRGPCEFWSTDAQGQWYLVAREVAPHVYERD